MTVRAIAPLPVTPSDDAAPVRVAEDRWRPERVGLLNVWQFVDEVLQFHRGRAVFFGPNGSGKTMALELLLPYLLDARGQPGRLSTSGGTDRGGFWSRITGYEDSEPKTGYLWVEFRRGSGATFTCGVRVRANASGDGERHWFTTTLRVGHGLDLLDSSARPLGPQQLRDALGEAGTIWGDDAAAYRAAVRQTLFPGRSEDQVEALIQTLLVVRKQNVSDGLSLERLSDLLSQALPPLDGSELGKVAEGFADLDRRRDHIEGLSEDLRAVGQLVAANRAYARHATAGVVQRVIAAQTEYDNVARTLKSAQTELASLNGQLQEAVVNLGRLEDRAGTLQGEREGIEDSAEFREGREISEVERTVRERAAELQRAERSLSGAASVQTRHASELTQAQADLAQGERLLRTVRRDLVTAVERVTGPDTVEVSDDALAGLLRGWLVARETAIQALRHLVDEQLRAAGRRDDANLALVRAREALDEAESDLGRARDDEFREDSKWRGDVDRWRHGLRELARFVVAGEPLTEPSSALQYVAQARANAREPMVAARAACEQATAAVASRLEALEQELVVWRAGRESEPDAPEGRRARVGVQGNPLYRLLDFSEGLEPLERGRVESALIESGMLDAWVSPDGSVELDEPASDVLALCMAAEASVQRAVQSPLVADPQVSEPLRCLAEAVLAGITWVDQDAHLGEAPSRGLVIGRDGTWRTTNVAGRAPDRPARFVGASSRQSARLLMIDQLEHERDELRASVTRYEDEWNVLAERLHQCDHEAESFPSSLDLENARRATRDAQPRVAERRQVLLERDAAYHTADERARLCLRELMRVASEHSLPTARDDLDASHGELRRIEKDTHDFVRALERRNDARAATGRAQGRADEALLQVEAAEGVRRAAELIHGRESSRLRALEAALGAPYRQHLARLEEIRAQERQIQKDTEQLRHDQLRLTHAQGQCLRAVEHAEEARANAVTVRTAAHEVYADLVADGLVGDAELEAAPAFSELDSMTAQLESVRRLRANPELGAPPEDATLARSLGRVQKAHHDATQRLAGRVSLTFEPKTRSWSVLRARQDGDVVSGAELRGRLEQDRIRAQAELDQKQQALFEEVLTGSLREHLRARLWSARELVDRINKILGGVRSAAGGVGVSLAWDIDSNQPEAAQLRTAKKLLLTDSPVSDGRAELDAFLRNRIEQIRADDGDTGEWRDRLERMLDYRAWHRFDVLVHHRRFGETPRSLRSRKVSLSAGEKTIVMVLPLIIAVVAHYEPANDEPSCESPRLLLMDELFPKLDFQNKAQLMGLLPRLHLDAAFTSDKDRCEYETLDGIAIHLFQKLDDDHTTTTRMVWNGRALRVTSGTEHEGTDEEPDDDSEK